MLGVHGLSKRYRSGRGHVTALHDLSFTVASGRVLLLTGRSGSGKSTLLNCLATLEQPDSGSIVCDGVELTTLSPRERTAFRRSKTGFVFQRGNLLPWLTVAENLRFPLVLNGIRGRAQGKRIEELLDVLGLGGFGPAMPLELSGGEAQRIAFARAIAHWPSLLLADELTASLDSANGRQLVEQMLSLCQSHGATLCLASHDQELRAIPATVLTLQDGTLENPS